MKRVILCIICLICLTGCSVQYDLDITEDSISEATKIYTDVTKNEMYADLLLTNFFSDSTKIFEPIYFNDDNYDYYLGGYQEKVRYYDVKSYLKNNYQGLEIQNAFSFSDYYRSSAVKKCFDELNIQKSENIYLIRTSNRCNVFNTYSLLDEIKVNVHTDLEIISNNADYVNGNTYTWIINRENYTNKSVRFSLTTVKDDLSNFDGNSKDNSNVDDNKKDDIKKDSNKNEENKDNTMLIIIVIGGFIVGLFVIIMIKKHVKY